MKPSKPVTPNMKDKVNRLYTFMKGKNDFVTKEEIGEFLGIANERSVRDVIAVLSTKKPIISTSDNKGYKLARTTKDIDLVRQAWMEIDSRQAELEKRKQPLIEFYDKAQAKERLEWQKEECLQNK